MIVCAAIKHNKTGLVICGVRHFDKLMVDQIKASTVQGWVDSIQGFVNHKGSFLTREEADIEAIQCDQIKRRVSGDESFLFSENLY